MGSLYLSLDHRRESRLFSSDVVLLNSRHPYLISDHVFRSYLDQEVQCVLCLLDSTASNELITVVGIFSSAFFFMYCS